MMPQPGQGGPPQQGGLDINALLGMLMQILGQAPQSPAGDVATGLPPTGIPPQVKEMSPEHQQMAQLHQMVQMLQMQQGGTQSQNAVQGGAGAPFGGLGGRPVGS